MINEAKMTELTQAEGMAYFRADLCIYSPESYSLDEKKGICNDMMSASKAVLVDAMREDFEQLPPPGCPRQAFGHALRIRSRVAPVVGCARGRRRPTVPRARAAQLVRTDITREKAVNRVGGLPLYSSSWCSSMISASFASSAFSSACIFRKRTPSPSMSIASASL